MQTRPNLQQYYEARYEKIKTLRETQDPNPYPHKFNVSIGIPAYIEKYESLVVDKGARLDDVTVSTVIRVVHRGQSGESSRAWELGD